MHWWSLLQITVVLLVLTRCLAIGRARAAVDLSVLVLMASSFGLSAAVQQSGLAAQAAQVVQQFLGPFGPVFALIILTWIVWITMFARRIPFLTSLDLDPDQITHIDIKPPQY